MLGTIVSLHRLAEILLILGTGRIARGSDGEEGMGNFRVSLLLFTDYIVLLPSNGHDLHYALERLAAKCEAAGMRVSSSDSEGKRRNVPSRSKVNICFTQRRFETVKDFPHIVQL